VSRPRESDKETLPYTFFAHQAPVIPVKLAWPRRFDGTALCVGSMTPDLAYPLGTWLSDQSHTAIGIVVWAVPTALVVTWAVRTWVAATAFAQLPDLGWFRLHSYRVLALGRPAFVATLTSVLIGAVSHVVIDAFTHADRFGAQWLGYDDVVVDVPLRGSLPVPDLLQDLGHLLGTVAGILLLLHIGRRRLLEQWYGAEMVARVREFAVAPSRRLVFWSIVAAGLPLAALWVSRTRGYVEFRFIDVVALSTALACALPVASVPCRGSGRPRHPAR
jgi:hypothetical protein